MKLYATDEVVEAVCSLSAALQCSAANSEFPRKIYRELTDPIWVAIAKATNRPNFGQEVFNKTHPIVERIEFGDKLTWKN